MQIHITGVTVNKYKSIQKSQTVEIDPSITTIVGMNESGKTSFCKRLQRQTISMMMRILNLIRLKITQEMN